MPYALRPARRPAPRCQDEVCTCLHVLGACMQGADCFLGQRVHVDAIHSVLLSPCDNVLIIGNDRTAVQAARHAASQGAGTITLLYRNTHFPLPRRMCGLPFTQLAVTRSMGCLLPSYYADGMLARAGSALLAPLRGAVWHSVSSGIKRKHELLTGPGAPPVGLTRDMFYSVQVCVCGGGRG